MAVAEPNSAPARAPLALVSFDVEEFDIPLEYGVPIDHADQIRIGAAGLERILDLLDRRRFPATFFTTASFAKARPDLLRRIAADPRHEIASHGLTHAPPVEADLLPSRLAIEDLLGVPVVGYRAARLRKLEPGAVAQAGYLYSASENPIWMPGRYNRFGDPRRPYVVPTKSASITHDLLHIPASASPIIRIPLFWLALKNLPMPLIKLATRSTLASDRAMNTYMHPWEFADIGSYALPRVVNRVDGETLLRRLDGYLGYLARYATPARYRDYAARFVPMPVSGSSADPSAAIKRA